MQGEVLSRTAAEANLDGLELLALVLLRQHVDGILVLLPGSVELRLRFSQLLCLQRLQQWLTHYVLPSE